MFVPHTRKHPVPTHTPHYVTHMSQDIHTIPNCGLLISAMTWFLKTLWKNHDTESPQPASFFVVQLVAQHKSHASSHDGTGLSWFSGVALPSRHKSRRDSSSDARLLSDHVHVNCLFNNVGRKCRKFHVCGFIGPLHGEVTSLDVVTSKHWDLLIRVISNDESASMDFRSSPCLLISFARMRQHESHNLREWRVWCSSWLNWTENIPIALTNHKLSLACGGAAQKVIKLGRVNRRIFFTQIFI